MLRAIILDFNGVILNDEPLHFRAMHDALAELGIALSRDEYWGKYLPLDDVNCVKAICDDKGVRLIPSQRRSLLIRKAGLYRGLLQGHYPLFPGAAQFVRRMAESFPLALASGARREEIENALLAAGLNSCFSVIVAAEDFKHGKPHPESFLLALSRLNSSLNGKSSPIHPEESLVVEDSMGGVVGARAAGMMCMAVTNSYPREKLHAANLIVASLQDVDADCLRRLFEERP
ncbi:MAG TPA: HAD family phosphatase [Acidobacteriota bacterium]|nr:HAD family phosphatase [Acidobacteriota bacterium]